MHVCVLKYVLYECVHMHVIYLCLLYMHMYVHMCVV